jgi:MFS transporter, MHS family, shikimate and dehydroshikimate transport protein
MAQPRAGATWPVSLLMIAIASVTILAVLGARETAPEVAKLRPTFK